MNYSKNLRKAAIVKRLVLLVNAALVIGIIIGASGHALKTHITAKKASDDTKLTNILNTTDFVVYGAYDDRCFTTEAALNWGGYDLAFTPLDVPLDADIQEFTYYLCTAYNIDFSLVMAIMQMESSYQTDAVGATNDYGLMQINSCNHEELTAILGVTDFLDPYQNIRAGVFTLRKLFERYQSTDMVLMAYNMGEDSALQLWEKGIYETDYTQSVMKIQKGFNETTEGSDT